MDQAQENLRVHGDERNIIVFLLEDSEKILEKDSLDQERIIAYSQKIKELHVAVLTKNENSNEVIKIHKNLWVYPVRKSIFSVLSIFNTFSIVKKELSWRKEFRANLIVTREPFLLGSIGMFLSIFYKRPFYLESNVDFYDKFYRKNSFMNFMRSIVGSLVARRAYHIQVPTKKIKESLCLINKDFDLKMSIIQTYIPVEKIASLTDRIDFEKKYPNFKFYILMHTTLSADKDILTALNAMKIVLLKYPKTGLIILSDGYGKRMLRLHARLMGISQNIIFEDEPKDPLPFYRGASLFLVTSKFENETIPAIEALACSCPVLSTPVGNIWSILKESPFNNFLCEVGDYMHFARMIMFLIENAHERDIYRINAKFILKKIPYQDYENYFNTVIKKWCDTLEIQKHITYTKQS